MQNLRIDRIPRGKKIGILVNGREVVAYEGETVFAALVASGYTHLRESHKLGECRGALCGMGVCYECLVTINGIPDQQACMAEVEDQMEIRIDAS
jgi:sarcosine oxidase subunit alpha